MACYNGPNPVRDEDRAAIWKWAKENGIDQGLPFERIHDDINQYFFGGQAKPEWITDILSGNKTPFKEIANDAWKKQYNRRVITQQAKDLSRLKAMGPVGRALQGLWSLPRHLAVMGHGVVFPITHGGDLALRPTSWAPFTKGLINTWTKSWSKGATERLLSTMRNQPLYVTALRSGLDVGPKSLAGNLIGKSGGLSSRAWDILTTMRFELWNREMQKFIKPDMSQTEVLDIGKNLAQWANHATGSAPVKLPKVISSMMFGPKLTSSKMARMFADPVTTIKTFSNWDAASPGEKAVAWTRLSGATQYFLTGLGMLAANQGVLSALGSKQSINFNNPAKSDFLTFKGGGAEWSLPGMHSEIRTLAQIVATSFMSSKQLRGESRESHLGDILGKYALTKATPAVRTVTELAYGQDYLGRPVPWSSEKQTPKQEARNPKYGWPEYLLTRGPILMQGPVKYIYNQMRERGASARDSIDIVKGLIITGLSVPGLHAHEDYNLEPKPATPGKGSR